VVSFAVFRSKGASEVSVSEVVTKTLDDISDRTIPNVELVPVDDTVFYTYGNYESALHTLVEGSLACGSWWCSCS
jgi:multidrug efflux pump subunit AcrB